MNPYVRIAYDSQTLAWLPYTRRIERLYVFIHHIVNILASVPAHNPRRLEQPGDEVVELVWVYDENGGVLGSEGVKRKFEYKKRIVDPGRGEATFCVEGKC